MNIVMQQQFGFQQFGQFMTQTDGAILVESIMR
jgi:hypothetical protein